MSRFLVFHAHFYQPPRANPFTGRIPAEMGAEPYANWNERITAECYRPNARLGNLDEIGFDLGPTLAEWLAEADAETYNAFLAADRTAIDRDGVGNALAQVYNHVILPLVPRRDKVTQIRWGIADFRRRYGRDPEGMWLSETAVDRETLEVLAESGVGFTILAPWQARSATVDTGEAYRVDLSAGRSIDVLFFDAEASKHVCFTPRVTENADDFLALSLPMRENWLRRRRGRPQLTLLAMDGEFFGHHQPGRDQFLRGVLDRAGDHGYTVLTPSAYRRLVPPVASIEIADRTAWSCAHGLARWEFGCTCTEGPGDWKGILQTALADLAEAIDRIYETETRGLFADPWEIRHEYAPVLLGEVTPDEYVRRWLSGRPDSATIGRLVHLLRAQMYRQLMFTSCGFFFEDASRIEPLNNLAYAARAIADTRAATGDDLTEKFRPALRSIRSWRTGAHGIDLYDRVLARR